jgi:hypothetical protein
VRANEEAPCNEPQTATPRSARTPKTKRRNRPNDAISRGASAARKESEVARLTRELDDALERQEATSEVLGMVSSSSGELDLIFRAILEKATSICEANFGLLFRLTDGVFQTVVVSLGVPPGLPEVPQPGYPPACRSSGPMVSIWTGASGGRLTTSLEY